MTGAGLGSTRRGTHYGGSCLHGRLRLPARQHLRGARGPGARRRRKVATAGLVLQGLARRRARDDSLGVGSAGSCFSRADVPVDVVGAARRRPVRHRRAHQRWLRLRHAGPHRRGQPLLPRHRSRHRHGLRAGGGHPGPCAFAGRTLARGGQAGNGWPCRLCGAAGGRDCVGGAGAARQGDRSGGVRALGKATRLAAGRGDHGHGRRGGLPLRLCRQVDLHQFPVGGGRAGVWRLDARRGRRLRGARRRSGDGGRYVRQVQA